MLGFVLEYCDFGGRHTPIEWTVSYSHVKYSGLYPAECWVSDAVSFTPPWRVPVGDVSEAGNMDRVRAS